MSAGVVVGRIHGPKGTTYELTAADVLWAARMLVGEGERSSEGMRACVSSMVRRLVVVGEREGRAPLWRTLTDLIVGVEGRTPGYSQPIAWQWRDQGSDARRARRARIRSLRWGDIPPKARTIAEAVCSGRLKLNAPAAVHFADKPTAESAMRRNPSWRRVPVIGAANVYLSTAQSRRAPEVHVVAARSWCKRLRMEGVA